MPTAVFKPTYVFWNIVPKHRTLLSAYEFVERKIKQPILRNSEALFSKRFGKIVKSFENLWALARIGGTHKWSREWTVEQRDESSGVELFLGT